MNKSWIRGCCIGRGSFGTINLAINTSNGVVSAVKSVDLKSCLPPQLEALENEIHILRGISSLYIVKYIGDDVTSEDSATFRNMHMEYLPGGTVADVATPTSLDEKTLRSYTWCIVSALRLLHEQGITHCDVKGKNVLVGPAPGSAKLADFGSAVKAASRLPPRGSPFWMAPEVVRGEYQGPESDIWALGCTVIEMVTGKPPWEPDGDTLSRVGYSDVLPRFPTQLSELGRDFLSKCLHREFTRRWTCDQLLQHPFISSSDPEQHFPAHSSPRSVLDLFSSAFFDDEEEKEQESVNFMEVKLKGRMRELGSGERAVWDSDGWTVVRSGDGAEDGGGITGEYSGSAGPIMENLDSVERTNLEHSYSDSRGRLGGEQSESRYDVVECCSGVAGCSRCQQPPLVDFHKFLRDLVIIIILLLILLSSFAYAMFHYYRQYVFTILRFLSNYSSAISYQLCSFLGSDFVLGFVIC